MGRYWATRRAGNAVPVPNIQPITNVHFTLLQEGLGCNIAWNQSPADETPVAVRLYRISLGVPTLINTEAAESQDGILSMGDVWEGEVYRPSVQEDGFAEVFGEDQLAA